jgi:asparagine synthase (glutamine-hydrolysing)
MTFLAPSQKARLYTPRLQEALLTSDVYEPVRTALGRAPKGDLLNRQLYADLNVYLADDILVKVDRMSMATSLETRAPFLDVDVMELAFSMPGTLKVRNGQRKFIVRQALQGLLPENILNRKKEGFSIPMKQWLRKELRPIMDRLLAPDRLAARGFVDPAETRRLIDEHCAGRANHAHVLFSLMVFERWAEEFVA